jgi:hypothetical protein
MICGMRAALWIALASSLMGGCKKDPPTGASAAASSTGMSGAAPTASPAIEKDPVLAEAPIAPTKGRCQSRVTGQHRSVRGAGVFVTRDGKLRTALNDDGVPRFIDATTQPLTEPLKAGRSPCAVAGEALYCASKKGTIRRYDARGVGSDVVEGAASASIAAGKVADREVVAFLRLAQTPSGVVREAWARTSDAQVVKISDDGAGATALHIVTDDDRMTFVTAEARTSLATVTVRNASVRNGQLVLAPPTVVFAGGGGDYLLEPRGVALSGGRLLLVAVLPQDLHAFGTATFVLDARQPTNVEPVWSLYARGLDDAPFAVAAHQGKTWMARVRPRAAEENSATRLAMPGVLALEIGRLDDAGRFVALGERAAPERPTHIALASETDALVIYVDGERGGQRERWACGS